MLWIKLVNSELLPFLCRYSKINKYNKWIGFWRWKLSKSGAVVSTCFPFPGRGGGYRYFLQWPLWRGSDWKGYLFHAFGIWNGTSLLLVFCLSERFFSGFSDFSLSPKTNLSKVQFDPEQTDTYKFLATSKCSVGKQITNYQFICLFF